MYNKAPRPHSEIVPRFEVDSPEGYEYLEKEGYVVFKNVATQSEVEKGISLAWDYLESLGGGIDRNNPLTWGSPNWPDPYKKGIVAGDGVGHSEFLWFSRGLPKVKKIFSTIWKEEDLITSFDGFCIHRPFEYNKDWHTAQGWYHLDQNGHHKPNKVCIQGFLNFLPAGPDDGGLVVIPRAHTIFNQIFENRPHFKKIGDFIILAKDQSFWDVEYKKARLTSIKICCEPGDFVLWDSRMIHCNSPAMKKREIPTDGTHLGPRRIVAYVCMTPQNRLTEEKKFERQTAYYNGSTTSHWPEEAMINASRRNKKGKFVPPELTEEQKKLIPL